MLRLFLFFLLFLTSLYAKEIHATYKVSFGIFGQIGEAKATMKVDDEGNYTITMLAEAGGLARVLSGGRKEWFLSQGKTLPNGMLRPDFYEHTVVRKTQEVQDPLGEREWVEVVKSKLSQFRFDHVARSIHKKQVKKRDDEVNEDPFERLDYYADNDLLSLFFNFKALSRDFALKEPTKMYAVGANDKDGRVDVIPVQSEALGRMKEELGKEEGHFYVTYINQAIFSSDRGELLVNLNDEGLCQKAVLKDVLLFGDITGELIEITVY